jgi:hypothetical protein
MSLRCSAHERDKWPRNRWLGRVRCSVARVAQCYPGRSVRTTRVPCGVPSVVYSHASRWLARSSRMRVRSRTHSSWGMTSNRPLSSRAVQTKKASHRQSSTLAQATLGRQSRIRAGAPQSGQVLGSLRPDNPDGASDGSRAMYAQASRESVSRRWKAFFGGESSGAAVGSVSPFNRPEVFGSVVVIRLNRNAVLFLPNRIAADVADRLLRCWGTSLVCCQLRASLALVVVRCASLHIERGLRNRLAAFHAAER